MRLSLSGSVSAALLKALSIALLFSIIWPGIPALAVDDAALRKAWALYNAKNYAASADAFEALIRVSAPDARLYYYAASANKSSGRIARAKQLYEYVAKNFAGTAEATSAQQALNTAQEAATALPAGLNGKSVDELMQTEEGRKALKEALAKQHPSTPLVVTVAPVSTTSSTSKSANGQDYRITPETVAKDGPDGITQFIGYPDCSFECSMASLAMQPKGQKLIADMFSGGANGVYIVKFAGGDGVEYNIGPHVIESSRVKDKAMWATLIHCALIKKFRNSYHGTLEEGLHCMTGKKTEKLYPASTTQQALTSFIADALEAQNPVVCAALDDFGPLPELVESDQAFSITAFDGASGMLTIRNPHGSNSRRFRLSTDPEHKHFEQLNDGYFKMHITMFPKYFGQIVSCTL